MSLALSLLVKRIRREFPAAKFEYFAVWETTRAGWPHLHLLTRGPFIPQPWLSRAWADLTGAPVVDIRQVHGPGQVASYVAKYLGKALAAPNNMKRYRCSLGFLGAGTFTACLRPSMPGRWEVSFSPTQELADQWRREGRVVHADHGLITGVPPPLLFQVEDAKRELERLWTSYDLSESLSPVP